MREANDSLDHIMVHFGSPTNLVRLEGLEPSTLALEGRCSIQLSYGAQLLNDPRLIWSG